MDQSSWTEDSVSFWRAKDFVLKKGIIDGNNSPSGVCQMAEASAHGITGGTVEDVDAINCGA